MNAISAAEVKQVLTYSESIIITRINDPRYKQSVQYVQLNKKTFKLIVNAPYIK